MNILPTGCQVQTCNDAPQPAGGGSNNVGSSSPVDAVQYSLDDSRLFNGTDLTVPVTCPEGMICQPNTYPPTVTFPPGTFVIPETPTSTGAPIVLQIQGCQSLLSTTLANNATAEQIQAAADALIYQAALQQAQCNHIPSIPPAYGIIMTFSPISKSSACIGASYAAFISVFASNYPVTFTVTGGTLPPGITLSSTTNNQAFFTGTATTAGTYTFTIQGSAPDGSVGYKAYTIIVGGITTTSPLTTATQNEVYSVTLAQTGFSGTLIWGIATGSLPDGLVINSSTGEITGTPTTIETASFTVFVQNSTQQCLKSFTLEVTEGGGFDWNDLVWVGTDNAIFGDAGGSISGLGDTVTASGTADYTIFAFLELRVYSAAMFLDSASLDVKLVVTATGIAGQMDVSILILDAEYPGGATITSAGGSITSDGVTEYPFTIPGPTNVAVLVFFGGTNTGSVSSGDISAQIVNV